MKAKTRVTVTVPVEKPTLLFTIAINTFMAVLIQCLFAALLFVPLREIWHANGLSSEGVFRLMTTAILISCAFTALIIVVIEYVFEKMAYLDDKKASR